MPELPEVETLRLQLSKLIIGKTIKSIDILKPKSFIGDKNQALGKKIVGTRRFAKILVLDLTDELHLAVHLKMSGQLIFNGTPNKHTRVIFTFTDGSKLIFNDQRIFGWIKVVQDLSTIVNKLGPDPLKELTSEKLDAILKTTKKPIKLLLMDQEKIAGVGNIYANDALFLSKINPKIPANKLLSSQISKLFNNLVRVLQEGIKWRGSSRYHYRDAYGNKGAKQEHFYVYDKEGDRCINNCGSVIKKFTLGGRGTFYCPKCQR